MGWLFSTLAILILLSFNVFAVDTIVRLRRDVAELHKAVARISPPPSLGPSVKSGAPAPAPKSGAPAPASKSGAPAPASKPPGRATGPSRRHAGSEPGPFPPATA